MEIGLALNPTDANEAFSGLDFFEANVQSFLVPESADDVFQPQLEIAKASATLVRAANCFLPAALKCVGPDVDHERILRYAENAFRRAELTGIELIVFGSGGSRQIPDGWPKEKAMDDFVSLLRLLGPIAQHHGVVLVVEPLGARECNFIQTLSEGAEVVQQCDHSHVKLLADSYHMACNGDPVSAVERHGALLAHVHIAELVNRGFPGESREDFVPFFRALKSVGYAGRVSMECRWSDVKAELQGSISYLRGQLAEAGF